MAATARPGFIPKSKKATMIGISKNWNAKLVPRKAGIANLEMVGFRTIAKADRVITSAIVFVCNAIPKPFLLCFAI